MPCGGAVKLIIAGGRNVHPTNEQIDAAFDDLLFVRGDVIEVICGMAQGADLCGLRWAEANGISVFRDPVTDDDYAKHGRFKAPKVRNWRMAHRAFGAFVFWDGYSGGSAHMIAAMNALGKPVRVMRP